VPFFATPTGLRPFECRPCRLRGGDGGALPLFGAAAKKNHDALRGPHGKTYRAANPDKIGDKGVEKVTVTGKLDGDTLRIEPVAPQN
jgi:hypothetical protein